MLVLAVVLPVYAAPPGLPAGEGVEPLAAFAWADEAGARAAWMPMTETAAVSLVAEAPRPMLQLPCNYAQTAMERASWDWKVQLDASRARGVQFYFYCADTEPVAWFSIYFRSGGGWYGAGFAPEAAGAWSLVQVNKVDAFIEGKPAGWGQIDCVRISGWRGGDKDTEAYLADFGLWDGDAPLVLLRNESAYIQKHSEERAVESFTRNTATYLEVLGLPYGVLSDLDLGAQGLQGARLLVLPFCPALGDVEVAAISRFLGGGGKLLSFYNVPASVLSEAGFRQGPHVARAYDGQFASIRPAGKGLMGLPDEVAQQSWNINDVFPVKGRSRVAAEWYDAAGKNTGHAAILVSDRAAHMTHVLMNDGGSNKPNLLLAMAGYLLPEYWALAARRSLAEAGAVGPYKSPGDVSDETGVAKPALAEAERLLAEGRDLMEAGRYPDAITLAGQVREAMVRAYSALQTPQPGEHRAFWCHNALGVDGMTWDEAIKLLADNGFTAILPNMLWGGAAYYPSEVLPVAWAAREKGDQVAACLAACKKHGVACHVWKVNYNMGSNAPKEFMNKMKREGRTQVLFDGTRKEQWLCPSHPDNQQLEIDAMVEVATKYAVDGVHFDYIRYPDNEGCFCAGCRARFEHILGKRVGHWPADLREDAELVQRWLQFRRDQITTVVAGVSQRLRETRTGVQISAAVFKNWPRDRDTIGQDWKLWCEKGYLDFVCPMDYTEGNVEFEGLVKRQLEWTGSVPCYPGIGLSVWADATDVVKLIEQIQITRRYRTGGFTIFNYGVPQAQRVVPLCGQGITRKAN